MKRKDLLELRGKSVKDLIGVVWGKRKSLTLPKKTRRDIAQILTIVREEELK